MAKNFEVVALVAALCFIALAGLAHGHGQVKDRSHGQVKDRIHVQGKVYCDTCRVEFETRVTEYLQDAQVCLQCRDRENEHNVTLSLNAKTDCNGQYSIAVEGDHENEICEVKLVESLRADCNEIKSITGARVALTKNNGAANPVRYANALGFLKTDALPICGHVLRELGFLPLF